MCSVGLYGKCSLLEVSDLHRIPLCFKLIIFTKQKKKRNKKKKNTLNILVNSF
jgi:hypothetical protein